MKVDWLSAVLRIKHHCAEKKIDDTAEVFSQFVPLLEAAFGPLKEESVAQKLVTVLSKALASVPLHELNQEKLDEMRNSAIPDFAWKSGTLDKLPDDCLKHALTFLDASGRCVAAELTCQRLFHLSRQTPLYCDEFKFDIESFHGLSRVRCRILAAAELSKALANEKWAKFRAAVRTLRFSRPFQYRNRQPFARNRAIQKKIESTPCIHALDLQLPNVSELLIEENPNATEVVKINELLKRTSVSCLEIRCLTFLQSDTALHLCALKQLRTLELCLDISTRIGTRIHDFDFTHIRNLRLRNARFHDICGLLHSKLESLCLIECSGEPDFISKVELSALKQLTLSNCETETSVWKLDAPNLQEFTVTRKRKEIAAAVEQCSATTLTIERTVRYFGRPLDQSPISAEFDTTMKAALRMSRVKDLTLVDFGAIELQWFADNMQLLPATVRFVASESELQRLGEDVLLRLKKGATISSSVPFRRHFINMPD